MNADFIRWADGAPQGPPLADILRSRPGAWAVVDELVGSNELAYRVGCVALDPDAGFEVQALPVDDGEYGVIYEIRARLKDSDS